MLNADAFKCGGNIPTISLTCQRAYFPSHIPPALLLLPLYAIKLLGSCRAAEGKQRIKCGCKCGLMIQAIGVAGRYKVWVRPLDQADVPSHSHLQALGAEALSPAGPGS